MLGFKFIHDTKRVIIDKGYLLSTEIDKPAYSLGKNK